ncbi:MAG: ribonuclease P protein component [Burkholderiales bacterium]
MPKTARLTTPRQFATVFQHKAVVSGEMFQVWYRPNRHNSSRLGIVTSKRAARCAVDRNLVKRLIREVFRQQRARLGNLDIVVRLRKQPTKAHAMREELLALFPRII